MKRGFSLIEIVVTLAVVAVLLVMVFPDLRRIFQAGRQTTLSDLQNIKLAITGDPSQISRKARTSFGYVGDMGNIPSSLMDLIVQGNQAPYVYNQALQVGAGWRGPYLQVPMGAAGQFKPDAYGNDYIYNTTPYTSADTGVQVIAKITSIGADATPNTSDDLKIEIFQSETFGEISGLVKDQDFNYVGNCKMTINYPSNGISTSRQVLTDSTGRYSFSNIPYGIRSITIEPQLIYRSKSALTKGGAADDLSFQVTNYAMNAITLSSLAATISSDLPAYFEEVLLDNVSVWKFQNFGNVRAASGQVIPFPPRTLAGTNLPKDTLMISVQAPMTVLTDRVIGRLNQGQTMTVRIKGFNDTQTGGGHALGVAEVPIQVNFSDGSVAYFIPTPG